MSFIRQNAASSWGVYKIFPFWTIDESTGGEESSTAVFESTGDETRFERWSEDRQRISLDKCTLSWDGNRQVRAFRRLVRGMANAFLFMDIREKWIGKPSQYGSDQPPSKKEFLGLGDGDNTDFQLRLYQEIQGDPVIRNIYFPNHAYPDLTDADGVVQSPTQRIRVWVDDVESFDWSINRINSGVIRFDEAPDENAVIEAFGTFFVLVRCNQDAINTKPLDSGHNFTMEGTEFIEPKGRR